MNCTFPSWLDSFIALYPWEILTERGGVVDDCARRRIAGKFLIKASKRRTRSLTIPTTQHPYPILFYVCSYIQFPIWPVHLIFSKLYKANALGHSREWWVCYETALMGWVSQSWNSCAAPACACNQVQWWPDSSSRYILYWTTLRRPLSVDLVSRKRYGSLGQARWSQSQSQSCGW